MPEMGFYHADGAPAVAFFSNIRFASKLHLFDIILFERKFYCSCLPTIMGPDCWWQGTVSTYFLFLSLRALTESPVSGAD